MSGGEGESLTLSVKCELKLITAPRGGGGWVYIYSTDTGLSNAAYFV